MLLIDRTWRTVALNYSLSRHTEYVRQIYNNSTVRLASVGLAQARPNKSTSVDARHLGASLSERSNTTWMGNSSQHTLHHKCESIVVQCCCFVSCMQVTSMDDSLMVELC